MLFSLAEAANLPIPSEAVLGSAFASVLLAVFMLVQAFSDRSRYGSFIVFAMIWFVLGSLDFATALYPAPDWQAVYEILRAVWCGAYISALIYLIHSKKRSALIMLGVVWSLSALTFLFEPRLVTTTSFVLSFGSACFIHLRQYIRNNYYSSTVLSAYYASMTLQCALFPVVMSSDSDQAKFGGYACYLILQVLSVFFGWIHLPRELRGQAPVRIKRRHGFLFFAVVLISQVVIQIDLIVNPLENFGLCIAFNLLTVAATTALYFYERQQLVVYTENVEGLLSERTVSLRSAQEDLTRANHAQAELLREQELDLRAQAVVIDRQHRLELAAQTAGQAAHDIQNLLSPLMIHTKEIEKNASSAEEVKVRAMHLSQAVEQLLDLNSQMLALSRRGRLERNPIRVSDLLQSLHGQFPVSNLTIENPETEDLWVLGSWSQLNRALSNLIVNALDASQGKSPAKVRAESVTIEETQRCHLGYLKPGVWLKMTVSDKGPGIPDEILERCFEPFFSSKTGQTQSGSGLGLSIVTAVIDDHEGILDMQTGADGTTFSLYIPSIEAPTREKIELTEDLSGNETVIVIDDDTHVLEEVTSLLKSYGYNTKGFSEHQEALHTIQMEHVDLLVLDMKMAGINGYQFFFGALHLRPDIKAIIHSSYVTQNESSKLSELGVSSFLNKPAAPLQMLKAIRQALGKPDVAKASSGID
ncbi:MAG: ATP-binding protein [Planctomycetota bacterium]|nr:ATP-binding protein [Planctomycetota bacterium]